jgi:hypothetical protein
LVGFRFGDCRVRNVKGLVETDFADESVWILKEPGFQRGEDRGQENWLRQGW